jgi:hypothetical protein
MEINSPNESFDEDEDDYDDQSENAIYYTDLFPFFNKLSHPLVIILSFILLPVLDDGINGLMGSRLLGGLARYDTVSIISASGIVILLINWIIFKRWMLYRTEAYLNMVGYVLMMYFLLRLMYEGNGAFQVREYFREKMSAVLFLGFTLVNFCFIFYQAFYKSLGWDAWETELDLMSARRKMQAKRQGEST